MMRRAILLLSATTMLFLGRQSPASQTRLASVGPASVFAADETDLWLYPAEINNHPGRLALELDSFPSDSSRASVLVSWSDIWQRYGAWGLGYGDLAGQAALKNILISMNYALANNPLMSPRNSIPLPDGGYHLFYARELGPITGGVHLSHTGNSRDREFSDTIPQDAVKRRAELGFWWAEAGVSAIIGDVIYLQTGAGFQGISFSSYYELSGANPVYWEKLGSRDAGGLRLNVRAVYGLTDRIKVVSAVSYGGLSVGYRADYSDTVHTPGSLYSGAAGEYDQKKIFGAAGVEYACGKDLILWGGVSADHIRTDITDSNKVWLRSSDPVRSYRAQRTDSTAFPWLSGGLEADLKEWLKLRLGAGQRPFTVKVREEYKSGLLVKETSRSGAEFEINFGLGFRFGRLAIDAQLNGDLPFNGGYLLSGRSGEPCTRLSMSYVY